MKAIRWQTHHQARKVGLAILSFRLNYIASEKSIKPRIQFNISKKTFGYCTQTMIGYWNVRNILTYNRCKNSTEHGYILGKEQVSYLFYTWEVVYSQIKTIFSSLDTTNTNSSWPCPSNHGNWDYPGNLPLILSSGNGIFWHFIFL